MWQNSVLSNRFEPVSEGMTNMDTESQAAISF